MLGLNSLIRRTLLPIAAVVSLACAPAGCQTSPGRPGAKVRRTTSVVTLPVTAEQDQLLSIVEDESLPLAHRRGALRKLKFRANGACVPRLVALLPGEWNSITYEILGILRRLRDPAALPALEAMKASLDAGPDNRRHAVSTSLIRALDRAYEACGGTRFASGE